MTSDALTIPLPSLVGREKKFISLRIKLLVGFTLLFSLIFSLCFYWYYNFVSQYALARVEDDLRVTLAGGIQGIDGDEFLGLANEAQPDASGLPTADPGYQKHQAWLEVIHKLEPRAFPYTYVPGQKADEVLFIGDYLRVSQPDNATVFREVYPGVEDMPLGFKGMTVILEFYQDEWGAWGISGYGPIRDASGETVGALGIDFKADYVMTVQENLKRSMVWAFLIAYTIFFAAVFAISRLLTQPILQLTRAAGLIGEGDYEQNLEVHTFAGFPDEINKLAHVFQLMVDKVKQREQKLIQQVKELRIEIDESNRNKQVQEIVDSDFFRELQEKAQRMRLETVGDEIDA